MRGMRSRVLFLAAMVALLAGGAHAQYTPANWLNFNTLLDTGGNLLGAVPGSQTFDLTAIYGAPLSMTVTSSGFFSTANANAAGLGLGAQVGAYSDIPSIGWVDNLQTITGPAASVFNNSIAVTFSQPVWAVVQLQPDAIQGPPLNTGLIESGSIGSTVGSWDGMEMGATSMSSFTGIGTNTVSFAGSGLVPGPGAASARYWNTSTTNFTYNKRVDALGPVTSVTARDPFAIGISTAAPEPTTLALLALGGLALVRRRKR